VLRAVVTAYVGEAAPVGSKMLSHVLPTRLSSASIRNTLAELDALGLVEQPHTSAGRVPSEAGLRLFIDQLLGRPPLSDYDRRTIDFGVEGADPHTVGRIVSQMLSERTRLLGFVLTPPMDRVVLQHMSLVRLSSDRVLAVLVSSTGAAYQRVVQDGAGLDDRTLERISAILRERVRGRTLPEVRDLLHREAQSQRLRADQLLGLAVELGSRALSADEADREAGDDLVIATRLALLDQPEFRDPRRIRELFEAIETKERLLEVLDEMLADPGVHVTLGGEVDDPVLQPFALVAARYGGSGSSEAPAGAVGVIGPSRMDYGRVMTLVDYIAHSLTEKLGA
jgi:heat-inducible transcriptional repressor